MCVCVCARVCVTQIKVVMPEDKQEITFGTTAVPGPGRVHDRLIPNSRWHATPVHSMTPQLREFQVRRLSTRTSVRPPHNRDVSAMHTQATSHASRDNPGSNL